MDTVFILRAATAVKTALLAHEAEIESLDRAIGDGDHFINIRRGIAVITDMHDELAALEPDLVLQKIGMKLLSTIGGASGPLIGSFFISMAKCVKVQGADTLPGITAAFAAGVDAIKSRGHAEVGEKTMLDVLVPVSLSFTRLSAEGFERNDLLNVLKREADQGLATTRDMIASKGRAASLGERAIGHLDPGAKTCQVIIHTICDLTAEN